MADSHKDREVLVPGGSNADIEAQLAPICSVVHRWTGHDFLPYKSATLCRRIRRRMQHLRMDSVDRYLSLIEGDQCEAEQLKTELLIGVSHFFRNPDAFETISKQILPLLCSAGPSQGPLRVWVAGCASGEEVYSLAILLDEHLSGRDRACQIFATDIDGEALREARQARYGKAVVSEISEQRRNRYFTTDSDGYRVVPALREMCSFSVQDLLRDPPFSALDLISCRNVLIYLQPQAQDRVIELFHYALRPGGFLFLGPSEGLVGATDLFEAVEKTHRIFRRKEVAPRPLIRVAGTGLRWNGQGASPGLGAQAKNHPLDAVSQSFARMLLEDYAPPSAVVNERGDLLFLAGRIGRFLNTGFCAPSHNLLDLTDGELRRALRASLAQSASQCRRVVRDGIAVETSEGRTSFRLTVRPLLGTTPRANQEGIGDAKLFAVVLHTLDIPELDSDVELHAAPETELVEVLEHELRETRTELQSTVEELESTNEELKSANEELQSANEELQSSQEELHSVNDELEDVNCKLEEKVHELRASNDDLASMFANTQIAILFLDHRQCIVKFTPTAAALFRLQDRDAGRSIGELSARFADLDLLADAHQAQTSIVPIERDAQTADGAACFIVRSTAYQAAGVTGVVVTFTDVTAIKRAQSEIVRLASFPERNPNPIVEIDANFRISYTNPVAGTLFPMIGAQGMQHPWLLGIDAIVQRLHQTGERSFTRELLVDGRYYEQAVHYLPDLGNVRIYGLDVSTRKKAEQDLQRERDFLERVMSTSPVGIVALDSEGHLTHANPAALSILGVSEGDALSRAFNSPSWEITDFEGRPIPDQELPFAQVARDKHAVFDVRHAVAHPDGSRVFLSINAAPILDKVGNSEGVVVALEDVSAATLAERALRESERKYRQLFENLTVGYGLHEMIYDNAGRPVDYRFLELNPAFEALTGLSRDLAVGKTVCQIIPTIEPHWIETYARVVETGQPLTFENVAKELGKHFEVLAFRPAPCQFAVIFQDVTARKRADEALLRTQKLDSVAVLAGGIAHDFNNLLAGLFGFLELAESASPEGSEARKHLADARAVYQRSRALAQQLLTFAKGGTPVKRSEDLRPILREAVGFALSGANISSRFQFEVDVRPCEVDRNQIAQAVDNLVLNARQAMPEGGTIEIEARNHGAQEVELVFRDHGEGIAQENLGKIFDPFFSTRSQGSGLGLASTYSIVKNHGGRIEVTSEVGKGSVFTVILPASAEPADKPEAPKPLAKPSRAARILVMDDEESILSLFGAMLGRMGHTATCCRHGEEAIDQFKKALQDGKPFDLAILDLTVRGGIGGQQTIAEIRKLDPRAKAIVSSGYAADPALASPREFGFCGRLLKPSSMQEIRQAIEECLARPDEA